MAKRLLCSLLAVFCIIALAACGAKSSETNSITDSNKETIQAENTEKVPSEDIPSEDTAGDSSDSDASSIINESEESNSQSTDNNTVEPYESETYIAKTGNIYDIEYYPITLYVDENGNDNVTIDNFAEIDFSKFTASDMNGMVTVVPETIIYTVSDGVISEGDSDDITSNTMIAIHSYQNDDGKILTNIYVYQ